MSPHHRRALALSMGLAALLYLDVVLFADREAVFAALWRISLPVLVAIFALSLLNYLLRFWRWQRYIAAFGHLLPWWRHFLYYLAGFTLTVTPAKAGDIPTCSASTTESGSTQRAGQERYTSSEQSTRAHRRYRCSTSHQPPPG